MSLQPVGQEESHSEQEQFSSLSNGTDQIYHDEIDGTAASPNSSAFTPHQSSGRPTSFNLANTSLDAPCIALDISRSSQLNDEAPLDLSAKPSAPSPPSSPVLTCRQIVLNEELLNLEEKICQRALGVAEFHANIMMNHICESIDLCTTPENCCNDSAVEKAGPICPTCHQKVLIRIRDPEFSPAYGIVASLPTTLILNSLLPMNPKLAKYVEVLNMLMTDIKRLKRSLLCIKRARKRQTSKLLSSHVRTARKVLTAATERRQFRNSYSDPNTCPLSMLSFVTVKQDRDAAVPSKIPDDELPRILPTELTVDIDSAAALPDNGSSNSDTASRTWVAATPPTTPTTVAGSRSFNLSKSPGKRRANISSSTSPHPAPPPSSANSESASTKGNQSKRKLSGAYRKKSAVPCQLKYRRHSTTTTTTQAPALSPTLPYHLQEHLRIQVKPPSEEGGKMTDTISPSTSSLATNDTFSPFPSTSTATGISSNQRHHPQNPHQTQSTATQSAFSIVEETEALRPPTPDIRRIELYLSDLCDGLRILLIEGTHLRAGTFFFDDSGPSTSFNTTNRDSSRNCLCLIRLDHAEKSDIFPSPSPSSPRKSPSHSASSSFAMAGSAVNFPRRRQGEVKLQAWQVVQQAVLEVVPVSRRQLPKGTRVCAAWSSTLANNLYPGVIATCDNAESQSVESASLLIAFDDGDHAEVPIHRIRMLPDHFANLTELNDTNTVVGRGVAPASPSSPSSAPGRSRCPSSSALVNKPKVENAQNRRMSESNVGRKRRVSAASVEKRDSENVLFNGGSGDVRDLKSMEPSTRVIWKPRGKQRRKFHGWPCYRSVRRNIDGLVISIGDTVRFRADNGPAYLGDVKVICASPENPLHCPRVYATWFYYPVEAGAAGKLAGRYEGAIFATDHVDGNDATCIIGHVNVARSLSEYRSAMSAAATGTKDNQKDDGESVSKGSNEEPFQYFVAGIYAPRRRKVISWDPDLKAELHLLD